MSGDTGVQWYDLMVTILGLERRVSLGSFSSGHFI